MKIDLFSQENDKEKLSHLKQMLLLAVADDKLDKKELGALAAVMSRDDMTRADFERCINEPESIEMVLPKDENAKAKYLRDMVLLMMADGVVEACEMKTCKLTAQALGYEPEVVDDLLERLISSIKEGK